MKFPTYGTGSGNVTKRHELSWNVTKGHATSQSFITITMKRHEVQ